MNDDRKEENKAMSSIDTQSLSLTAHNAQYSDIDPNTTLKGSALGKTIFISGASRGIGQATAIAFAQAGAQAIYITARSERALEETRRTIVAANPQCQCAHMVCDVTQPDSVEAAIEDCVTRFGGIDVADANAGYLGPWKKIGESDITSWWTSWEVNLKGTYYVVRYALSHLIESARKHAAAGSTGGHMVLITSLGAQLLIPGASDYQTSKHAINRLCEFIQLDHGADGIKCFAIHPGGVSTELARKMPEEFHANLTDEPELAAGFTVWLCSGKADWAAGRYLSSNWDVSELLQMKDEIINDDLLVNRLRTSG
jgi:NAD(P)-dependent dehydrogenase (short-subunit alcohol dehydrogenase family)